MPSYFPVSILAPSKARLAKGPTVQKSRHPWKDKSKRKRKSKAMTRIIYNDAKRATI